MTTERNDGGAAFPCEQGHTPDGSWNQSFDPGMTLRDYFAAKALPAIHSEFFQAMRAGDFGFPENWRDGVARDAYQMADAMLKARRDGL